MKKYGQNRQDAFEISVARQAYLNWERENAEEVPENQMRKKLVDLSVLVRDVINEDLTPTEKGVVEQYWFEGKNLTDIAAAKGVNVTTVLRTLRRANGKIQKIMRHVVKYEYDLKKVVFLPVVICKALAIAAAEKAKPNYIGGRIRRLRIISNITVEQICEGAGIDKRRLSEIENGALPNLSEVVRLASFFQATTDYILNGG